MKRSIQQPKEDKTTKEKDKKAIAATQWRMLKGDSAASTKDNKALAATQGRIKLQRRRLRKPLQQLKGEC